jgi:hypothetical protein
MREKRPDDYAFVKAHKATIFKGDLDETENRLKSLLASLSEEDSF